jgi:hypothetical protein
MGGKPGFPHYDAGVPRTLAPYPQKTLLDYVANTAIQWPPHPALLFKGRCVTYGELTRLSDAGCDRPSSEVSCRYRPLDSLKRVDRFDEFTIRI